MKPIGYIAMMMIACSLGSRTAMAETCEGMKRLNVPQMEITSAERVAGGTFDVQAAQTVNGQGVTYRDLPPFCRVAGTLRPTADSEIRFEVWLPENWNGRFQQVGNGGYGGKIVYRDLSAAIRNGFASANTDNGHDGVQGDAKWVIGHPEKVIDFGYRAVHQTRLAAAAIISEYYGQPAKFSYFMGCSDGGREGLMEAQRYPEDFDGWALGAPAWTWSSLFSGLAYKAQLIDTFKGPPLTKAQVQLLSSTAIADCDAIDGVKDGLIEDPRKCRFDPSKLICKAGQKTQCLEPEQARLIQQLYRGLVASDGRTLAYGLKDTIGTEADAGEWWEWISDPDAKERESMSHLFGDAFYKNMVYGDPSFNIDQADLAKGFNAAHSGVGKILDASSPDLASIRKTQKKIIQYHGWGDNPISPEYSFEYYRSVQKAMGGDVSDFYRLFMVPGMHHCSAGAGPNAFGQVGAPTTFDPQHHILAALMQWVEKGKAPARIVATKYQDDDSSKPVIRTMPLCVYPKSAAWTGKGSKDAAANYVCSAK